MKKDKIILNNILENEIEEFKTFITDPLNIKVKHKQREVTFEKITKRSIISFIQYLKEEKDIEIDKINSLYEYIKIYFIDYVKYIYSKYKTDTFDFKTRFISSIIHFYIDKLKLDEHSKKELVNIKTVYSQIKNNCSFVDGKVAINKSKKENIHLSKIIDLIKRLDREYIITKSFSTLRHKIFLKILVHLGWRSRNIMELEINNTIYLDDNVWKYAIPPSQQKSPLKVGHKEKYIRGEFPDILQHDLTDYYKQFKPKKYFFLTKSGRKFNNDNFRALIIKLTKNRIKESINPHLFRTIVRSYLYETGFDIAKAELFLWHNIPVSEVGRRYINIDINQVVLEVNEHLEKLYKEKHSVEESKGNNNVISFEDYKK